jgi:uncharacterized protein YgbK (DUF1537 family)
LFFQPPSSDQLNRFSACRAVGVAGVSRSQSPEWMDRHLPPIFESLKSLGAPLCHYKTCSTFDSSPRIGNIGRAIEIGRRVFGSPVVPLVVGAPALRRYQFFGNLFAVADGVGYRLDRHPTMSRHPVTPMDEADLRLHLARQAPLKTALVDILALLNGAADQQYERALADNCDVILFDVLDEATLRETGRLIWSRRQSPQTFVAGSSGVEYALIAAWRAHGLLPETPRLPDPGPVDRLLVVSGSCSPVTEAQIRWATGNGFVGVALDPAALVNGDAALRNAVSVGLEALKRGRSVVLYSALGPSARIDVDQQRLGERLGVLARLLVESSGVRRVVIAGGDTSGHAGQQLGICALTMLRPMAPGSPLCLAYSSRPETDGLEILLKGGQVGGAQLFGALLNGKLTGEIT